jgi:putative intracellular protease/amidase
VLVLLGENFEEIEFAAFTGVLSWASHTNEEGDYMFPRGKGEKEVSLIEVVVAGFAPEVRGMGSMCIRPDVLVQNLKPEEIDCFDAVAIPACVGGGRGQHTWKGQGDLESPPSLAIVRRVHEKGGIIATMCAAITVLEKAGLPFIKPGKDVDSNVTFEKRARTITCGGPRVATETACMLLKALVDDREYRSFRQYNPWLFGGKDEFAPRLDVVK